MDARRRAMTRILFAGGALLLAACGSTATTTTATTSSIGATSTTSGGTVPRTTSTTVVGKGTTVPATSTPTLAPNAARGTIHGSVTEQVQCVAAPCPPQPIPGRVTIKATTGQTTTVDAGTDGTFVAQVEPGSYTLHATSPRAGSCPDVTVTVSIDQSVTAEIVCDI